MSQVHKLDVLMSKDFDDAAGAGPWVPLPDVIALGIGPYSRRFQDLRKVYLPMGFDVENRIERGGDGVTRSWYRKVRVGHPQAERPESHHQSGGTKKARRSPGGAAEDGSCSSGVRPWRSIVSGRGLRCLLPP